MAYMGMSSYSYRTAYEQGYVDDFPEDFLEPLRPEKKKEEAQKESTLLEQDTLGATPNPEPVLMSKILKLEPSDSESTYQKPTHVEIKQEPKSPISSSTCSSRMSSSPSYTSSSSDSSYEYQNTATPSNSPEAMVYTPLHSNNSSYTDQSWKKHSIDTLLNGKYPSIGPLFRNNYMKPTASSSLDYSPQLDRNNKNQENKMEKDQENMDIDIPKSSDVSSQNEKTELKTRKSLKEVKHNTTPYQKRTPKREARTIQKRKLSQIEYSLNMTIEEVNEMLDYPIDELNTKDIGENIKYWIKKSKHNMTKFANNILGRSQGTCSILLNNPIPWNELRNGKVPYIRMYNWLQLEENQKDSIMEMDLQVLQKIEKEEKPQKASRSTVTFTSLQKAFLGNMFAQDPHPTKEVMEQIADKLELGNETVKNYFANQRRRVKQKNMIAK